MGLIEFAREKDLQNLSYFLSNRSCFFHRFADSGFKNKWTGLWKNERKFLEYFAIRAGDAWLSPETCKSVRYNFAKAVHSYAFNGADVKETIFIPRRDMLVIELSSNKSLDAELELAVNIRKRVENRNERGYSLKSGGKSVLVRNSLGSLSIRTLCGEIEFQENQAYMEHSPSGETQSYFRPGKFYLKGRKIAIGLAPCIEGEREAAPGNYRNDLKEKEKYYQNLSGGKIDSDNNDLVRGFKSAILATELLRKKTNDFECYYAGLPWFQQFWARDVLWVVPSLVGLGYFNEARSCLQRLASLGGGCIPNFMSETEGYAKNSIDSTLLWLISLEYYVMASADLPFLRKMEKTIISLLDFLSSRDIDLDGFIEHDISANETWMDTLKRSGRAVEIQSLYFRAMLSAKNMLEMLGFSGTMKPLRDINTRLSTFENIFDANFFHNGFYLDTIPASLNSAARTANAIVPLLCGLRKNERQILNAIESDAFTTGVGVRCLALGEGFGNGYHTGMVWSLTTAWASAAEFAAKRPAMGWKYLKMLMDDMEKDSLGSVGECWDSISLEQKGCYLQLWGTAFIPRLVDEFMLGIRIDALNRCVFVSPSMPPETSLIIRKLVVGKEKVGIRFVKTGKRVSVSSDNSKIKIINALRE